MLDASPYFPISSATITLSEKTLPNTHIYQLTAMGESGIQFFYNTTKTLNDTQVMFIIGDTGIIWFNGTNLDYESGTTQFDLYIDARNSELVGLNEFHLVIKLSDINDNSPIFNASSYAFNVVENRSVYTTVGKVFATDADGTNANNQVKYYILNDMFGTVFQIDQISGQITTASILDYEFERIYILTACATDNATDTSENIPSNERRSTCVPVTISVLNLNEHLPVFDASSYLIQISEKAPNGQEIFRFSATDGDHTPIYFQYNTSKTSAEDMATFELNNVTGLVTLNASKLDFEIQSKYFLYVFAIDSVSLLKGDTTELVIELIDINDNSPIFANNLYEATILESAGNGSFITSVSASDKDGISNGAIVYYILPNHYSNKFAVNSSTGDILVDSQLDYEAGIHTFILTVCANDTTTDSRQNDPGIQLCSVLKFTFPSMYVMT